MAAYSFLTAATTTVVPLYNHLLWLTKVDSALASDKTLELDAALGSQSVQYKEVEVEETGKFLSYFKPCIIPVEGVYSSGQVQLKGPAYETRLLTCKGDRVVHVKEVPFSRSSLNHRDVFILDTATKFFQFSGCNSSIQERAKALEVVQYIKEYKHKGNCEVAAILRGGPREISQELHIFFSSYYIINIKKLDHTLSLNMTKKVYLIS